MVLKVNGETIDEKLIEQESNRLRSDYQRVFTDQPPGEQEKTLREWSRENIIERILIKQYAEKNVEDVPAEQFESAMEEVKKNFKQDGKTFDQIADKEKKNIADAVKTQLKIEQFIRDLTKDVPEPDEKQIEKFYNEHKQMFKTPEQIRVSHIVKHINWQTDEKTAQEMIGQAQQQLDSGQSFEAVATRFSDCPDKGGDLGYFPRGNMVEEFEDIVFNLNPGQVSDIFQTRYGYHIAKLYDRKPETTAAFDDVKDHIAQQIKEEAKKDVIDQFVDKLKESATIEG